MIINQTSTAVNNTAFQQKQFGLVESAHLYKVLYSSLYEDKEQVTLGELAANALDAQRVNGTENVPVKIQLPTELDPQLVVQDCGVGMSLDTVQNLYTTYGASTKRDNDDDIGGFGYGSKSPLSLSDSFSIETTHEGVTTTASCYLDEGLPKFAIFSSSHTGRPSGTIIRVPVADTDTQQKLHVKAKYLFAVWKVKPEISGFAPSDESFYSRDFIVAEQKEYTLLHQDVLSVRLYGYGANRYNYQSREDLSKFVSVGPFIYNIPVNLFNELKQVEEFQFIQKNIPNNLAIVPSFPIGTLELSPTREKIEDTKANKEALLSFYRNLHGLVVNSLPVAPAQLLEQIYEVVEKDLHYWCGVGFWVNPEHVQKLIDKIIPTGHEEIVTYWLSNTALTDLSLLLSTAGNNPKVVFDKNALPFKTRGYDPYVLSYRNSHGILDVSYILNADPVGHLIRVLGTTLDLFSYSCTSAGAFRKDSYFSSSRSRENLTLIILEESESKKVSTFLKQNALDLSELVVIFADDQEKRDILNTVKKLQKDGADLGTVTIYETSHILKAWKTRPKAVRQVCQSSGKSVKRTGVKVGTLYTKDSYLSSVYPSDLSTLVDTLKSEQLYVLIHSKTCVGEEYAAKTFKSVDAGNFILLNKQQYNAARFQKFLKALDKEKVKVLPRAGAHDLIGALVERKDIKDKIKLSIALRKILLTFFTPTPYELVEGIEDFGISLAPLLGKRTTDLEFRTDHYGTSSRAVNLFKESVPPQTQLKLAALTSRALPAELSTVLNWLTAKEKTELQTFFKTLPNRVLDTGETS